jgi:hypothetical protein
MRVGIPPGWVPTDETFFHFCLHFSLRFVASRTLCVLSVRRRPQSEHSTYSSGQTLARSSLSSGLRCRCPSESADGDAIRTFHTHCFHATSTPLAPLPLPTCSPMVHPDRTSRSRFGYASGHEATVSSLDAGPPEPRGLLNPLVARHILQHRPSIDSDSACTGASLRNGSRRCERGIVQSRSMCSSSSQNSHSLARSRNSG